MCPVRIDIPDVLVHLRAKVVDAKREHAVPTAESVAMRAMAWVFGDEHRLAAAQRAGALGSSVVARHGRMARLPGPLSGWTDARDAPTVAAESFRDWWQRERAAGPDERRGSGDDERS